MQVLVHKVTLCCKSSKDYSGSVPVYENMQRELDLLLLLSERFEANWMFLQDTDFLAVERYAAFLSL